MPNNGGKYKVKELAELMKYAYAYTLGCVRCRSCAGYYVYDDKQIQLKGCPSYWRYKFTAFSAGGKIFLLNKVHQGLVDFDEDLAEVFYKCTTCGLCKENCIGTVWQLTESFDPVRIFELVRAELFARGLASPKHKIFVESIIQNHNPYREKHEDRFKWMPAHIKIDEQSDLVYFVGCTSSYRRDEIAKATVEILHRVGIPFKTLGGEEWCCGSPALRVGARELARELAEHNVRALEKMKVSTVITSCAGCYRMFKKDYPEMLGKLPFEVLHTSEFLERLLDEGKLKLEKEVPLVVTYHDPCHLGRHVGVFEAPRKALEAIPGLTLVEMPRHRKSAWCCGAGGGVKAAYPDFALWTAIERVKEAIETGAKALISTCPFCSHNLKDAIQQEAPFLAFYDLTELILKAMP